MTGKRTKDRRIESLDQIESLDSKHWSQSYNHTLVRFLNICIPHPPPPSLFMFFSIIQYVYDQDHVHDENFRFFIYVTKLHEYIYIYINIIHFHFSFFGQQPTIATTYKSTISEYIYKHPFFFLSLDSSQLQLPYTNQELQYQCTWIRRTPKN